MEKFIYSKFLYSLDNLDYEIKIKLNYTLKYIVINISQIPSDLNKFESIFNIHDLIKSSNFFRIFYDIKDAYEAIKEFLNKKNFLLIKNNNSFTININVGIKGIKNIELLIEIKDYYNIQFFNELYSEYNKIYKENHYLKLQNNYLNLKFNQTLINSNKNIDNFYNISNNNNININLTNDNKINNNSIQINDSFNKLKNNDLNINSNSDLEHKKIKLFSYEYIINFKNWKICNNTILLNKKTKNHINLLLNENFKFYSESSLDKYKNDLSFDEKINLLKFGKYNILIKNINYNKSIETNLVNLNDTNFKDISKNLYNLIFNNENNTIFFFILFFKNLNYDNFNYLLFNFLNEFDKYIINLVCTKNIKNKYLIFINNIFEFFFEENYKNPFIPDFLIIEDNKEKEKKIKDYFIGIAKLMKHLFNDNILNLKIKLIFKMIEQIFNRINCYYNEKFKFNLNYIYFDTILILYKILLTDKSNMKSKNFSIKIKELKNFFEYLEKNYNFYFSSNKNIIDNLKKVILYELNEKNNINLNLYEVKNIGEAPVPNFLQFKKIIIIFKKFQILILLLIQKIIIINIINLIY